MNLFRKKLLLMGFSYQIPNWMPLSLASYQLYLIDFPYRSVLIFFFSVNLFYYHEVFHWIDKIASPLWLVLKPGLKSKIRVSMTYQVQTKWMDFFNCFSLINPFNFPQQNCQDSHQKNWLANQLSNIKNCFWGRITFLW